MFAIFSACWRQNAIRIFCRTCAEYGKVWVFVCAKLSEPVRRVADPGRLYQDPDPGRLYQDPDPTFEKKTRKIRPLKISPDHDAT